MQNFAQLIYDLENTSKTKQKLNFLIDYFQKVPEEDKLWTVALFSHRGPKRQVNTRLLAEWAMEVIGIEKWLFDECYGVVGDLAETIALILPEGCSHIEKSLSEWIKELSGLSKLDEEQKKCFIKESWDTLQDSQKFVFNKLITGGFRVGISEKMVFKALSKIYDLDEAVIAHRLSGNWRPEDISLGEYLLNCNNNADSSKPYPFYLAYPLEQAVTDLGKPTDWLIEWKWDGIRAQLIKRNDEIFLWSRGGELITTKFPEFEYLKDILPNGTVLDGELLAFQNDKPLAFKILQTRISRKNVSKKHLREAPASIICYDILEWQGVDIREKSMNDRRLLLENIIPDSRYDPRLMVSEKLVVKGWDDVSSLRDQSRDKYAEGLMLKRNNSRYQTGRKRGDWWKWKIDPFSIDAVMIYAQKGHGRRADIYSDYTFAVWKDDQLVPFAKAYSGLNDGEMRKVSRFVNQNTLERFGPVRTVRPELVFEIHFEGINLSPRHKSGIAVRFPRINRWRTDKLPKDANSLEDLKALINV